jgi:hypothetical protein
MKFTLDHLMRVCGTSDVNVRGLAKTYYLRTIGQRADDARRDFAVSQSREMYNRLKNPESAEYAMYLTEFGTMSRTDLEAVVRMMKLSTFRREASYEVNQNDYPEPPDRATITDIIEAEEANEKAERDVVKEREVYVKRLEAEYAEAIKTISDEQLVLDATALRIDQLTSSEFAKGFNDSTLYSATFVDEKRRKLLFGSPQEVAESDPGLRQKLLDDYLEMDAFTQEPDELKN